MKIRDRVSDTTTSTGTGNLTLGGAAPTGYQSVGAAFSVGDGEIPFVIAGGAEWEIALCTLIATNTLRRDQVLASSNADAAVNFSAGSKSVRCTLAARAGAGGRLPAAFSTTVRFTHAAQMAQQNVTGALAFTADATGALDGVEVWLDLIANGTNIPTFTGMREWDGSSGWVNTSGVRNCVTFFRRAGVSYYCINQQVGAAAEPTPATAVTLSGASSGVVNAPVTLTLGFNGAAPGSTVTATISIVSGGGNLSTTAVVVPGTFTYTPTTTGAKVLHFTNDGGLANPGDFTYTSNASATVPGAPTIGTAVAGDTQATVSFTAPGSNGGAAITGYTATSSPGGLTGTLSGSGSGSITVTGLTNGVAYTFTVTATNSVGTSSPSAASNSVTPSGLSVARLTVGVTSLTESGNGTTGWIYTAQNTGFTSSGTPWNNGTLNVGFQAGVDGEVRFDLLSAGESCIFGVDTNSTNSRDYREMDFAFYAVIGAGSARLQNGVQTSMGFTPLQNDKMRIKRVGSSLSVDYFRSGVWTNVYTWTGAPTGALFFGVNMANGGASVGNFLQSGLA